MHVLGTTGALGDLIVLVILSPGNNLLEEKKTPGIETLLGARVSINTLLCVLAELNPKVTSRNHVFCLYYSSMEVATFKLKASLIE